MTQRHSISTYHIQSYISYHLHNILIFAIDRGDLSQFFETIIMDSNFIRAYKVALAIVSVAFAPSDADAGNDQYWNTHGRLLSLRLPMPPAGYVPEQLDFDGDGWYGDNLPAFAAFYEIANARFPGRRFDRMLGELYTHRSRTDHQALLSGTELKGEGTGYRQPSICYPKSGFACLRSGNNTVVFKFDNNNAGGHEHPDKLSFTLHNGNKEIFPDFGTSGYGTPEYLGWYKHSLSHNTMNVDGLDQSVCRGRLVAYEADSLGAYAAGVTDKSYPGVVMRRAMRIRGNVVSDTLTCKSDSSHFYEYVLLFGERPEIAGKWTTDTLTAPPTDSGNLQAKQSPAYSAIREVKSLELKSRQFTARTHSARVDIQLSTLPKGTRLYLGTASGMPSNPTISVGSAASDAAAQPCYPMIIRIPSSDIDIHTRYTLHQ